jgi:tRNA (adenine22-N1)-methyltransferase
VQISKRIQNLVSLVPADTEVVWDLCCDHGLIGQQFLKTKKVKFVDQVPCITERLKQNIKATDIPPSYSVITSSATQVDYKIPNSSTFIIAGVGAVLGIEILNQIEKSLKPNDSCLVSVHKNNLLMRRHLIRNNFKVVIEKLVEDNSQFYEMLLVSKSVGHKITEIGDSMWNDCSPELKKSYIDHQISFYGTKSKFNPEYNTILKQYENIAK